MAIEPSHTDVPANHARFDEEMVAMNEALVLGSLRQPELTEAAECANAQLQLEIAARQKTARELAEKARLLDLTHDAIIVRDFDDKITLWNEGAEKLYGWSSEEVIGKDLHSFLQTGFPKPRKEIEAQLWREGRFAGEVVQIARDGRRVTSLCRWVLDRQTRSILTSYTDITERAQAVEALQASEARFRTAISVVGSLIWTSNAFGEVEGDQLGWANFTGQTREEYQGSGWINAVHPEDAQRTADAWAKAVAGRRLFEFEHRLRRADGEWRLCSIRAVPVFTATGTIREWVGVHTEITERRHSEKVLRENEERLRALVTTSSEVVYQMSADWTEMGVLDGRDFLKSAAEPSRTWFEDNVHVEDQAHVLEVIRQAIRTRSIFALEHRVYRVDGTVGWAISKAVPLFNDEGEIVEWFGAASDVTERREAEAEVRATSEFMRSIIESSSDCIKVLDLEGNLLSMEAGQGLLGITDLTPLLGKPWITFWENDEDQRAAREGVAAAAAGGEGHFVGFFRTLHGEDKWWDVVISPIRNGDGDPERLLAVSRDITKRRQLEESLLARAEDLARADRSKDEFLAMLAHELRNPLAPLRNAAEILQTEEATADERTQAQRIIGRQIESMSRMIDDLLDVARITEGKIELRKQPVALEAILTAATSLVRSDVAARHQDLAVSMPKPPVFLHADAARLEQVFVNLLSNACKYSDEGCHIAITAERAVSAESPEVIVRVRDDGVGIDPELLPRIFDLFVQATRSLDRTHGGLGIGLTLVSRLVKLHGGSVEVRSEGLGHGSEFVVRLPTLLEPPAPVPVAPLSDRGGREPSRRILVVDDNTDSARSMAVLQTRRGHLTRTAFDGADALAVAAEFLPEVVLLDIGLPGMDGYEVARHLRKMPALAGVLLIAMTGYASPEDRRVAKEAGFDEHLAKPVDLDTLREWLRNRI
jgi:PAS domain S-box-containing protein